MKLQLYTWYGIMNDYGEGQVHIISDSIENARLGLIEQDVLDEGDMMKVAFNEPEIRELNKDLTIYCRGSA